MSTIKIYTPSGENIYFHDVDDARLDEISGIIKIKQKHREYSSEVWVMRENISCLQSFISEIDALYFEPIPPEEKEKPKDNNNWQAYSIISITVSVACLIMVISMSLI